MKLPMQLQHTAMTRKQRSLSSADLLKKAFAAGWNYADQDSSLLIRPVPYHTRIVQLRITAHAQALGIPANVHPHMMRHSFASHVLQSSGDLRAVQEMLGHSSISATQVYTALDFQHLAKVYDATHPRAKK